MRDFHDLTERGRAARLRRVAERALASYDVVVLRLRLITNASNGIFRVDTPDGPLVIRVGLGGHIGHSLDEVRSETEWLAALAAETDLRVPAPVPARNGRLVVAAGAPGVPERRNCVVFRWIPGPLLADRLSPARVAALGAYAAGLHRHGAGFGPLGDFVAPRYDRLFPFDEPVVLFESPMLSGRRESLFREAAARVEDALDRLRRHRPGLLHGDLHQWNVKVVGRDVAAFDFEDLMWGWPVQDLATTLYYYHGLPEYRSLRAALETGYRGAGGVWPDDADIDTFLAGRSLVLANDVLVTPEWRSEMGPFFERAERRLEALLGGGEFLA